MSDPHVTPPARTRHPAGLREAGPRAHPRGMRTGSLRGMAARLEGARWLALLPAALLISGLLALGLHHHDAREDGSHPCAVCAIGGAPAAIAVIVAIAPPLPRIEAPATREAPSPTRARVRRAESRAPPIA